MNIRVFHHGEHFGIRIFGWGNFVSEWTLTFHVFFGKFHNSSFTINIDCPSLSNTLKNTLFKCDSNDAIRTEKALFLIKLQQFEDFEMIFLDLGKNRIKFECISVFFMKKKRWNKGFSVWGRILAYFHKEESYFFHSFLL